MKDSEQRQLLPSDMHLQAFQELNRGEQTATALENHLAALEAKIDELLAASGQSEQNESSSANSANDHTTTQN
jgi:exonuclease VII small subunit